MCIRVKLLFAQHMRTGKRDKHLKSHQFLLELINEIERRKKIEREIHTLRLISHIHIRLLSTCLHEFLYKEFQLIHLIILLQ
jgi:hypothetical protein